jgi:5-methylcytosine-specific restriction protein A
MTEIQLIYTTAEASEFLRFSRATLDIWRSNAKGPPYLKIGHSVRYRRDDLELWLFADEASRTLLENASDCHASKREKTKRPRGRAGKAQRQRRLAAEPYCRDCREDGVKRLAEEIDHIIRLEHGGSDEDDNTRCLCKPCHAARTRG